MSDVYSKERRSHIMRSIKSKDTTPEIFFRKALFSLGYRYRLHVRTLPGKPDIVLSKYRTVIEIRGCFWHGHDCKDGHIPKSNQTYWQSKIEKNRSRDFQNEHLLAALGWTVITVWECECNTQRKAEITASDVDLLLRRVEKKKTTTPTKSVL